MHGDVLRSEHRHLALQCFQLRELSVLACLHLEEGLNYPSEENFSAPI